MPFKPNLPAGCGGRQMTLRCGITDARFTTPLTTIPGRAERCVGCRFTKRHGRPESAAATKWNVRTFHTTGRVNVKRIVGIVLAALITALVPPALAADMPPLGQKKIIYTHGPWGSGLVTTNVVQMMLKRLGYDVELKLVDVGLAYQALASGKAEIFSSAYLPGQQQYLNAQAGKIEIFSVSYSPVPGGLMVPAYVPANTIEDLKKPEIQKLFGGKITGIDAGSGVMAQARSVIEKYGLDFELVPSSDAAIA